MVSIDRNAKGVLSLIEKAADFLKENKEEPLRGIFLEISKERLKEIAPNTQSKAVPDENGLLIKGRIVGSTVDSEWTTDSLVLTEGGDIISVGKYSVGQGRWGVIGHTYSETKEMIFLSTEASNLEEFEARIREAKQKIPSLLAEEMVSITGGDESIQSAAKIGPYYFVTKGVLAAVLKRAHQQEAENNAIAIWEGFPSVHFPEGTAPLFYLYVGNSYDESLYEAMEKFIENPNFGCVPKFPAVEEIYDPLKRFCAQNGYFPVIKRSDKRGPHYADGEPFHLMRFKDGVLSIVVENLTSKESLEKHFIKKGA